MFFADCIVEHYLSFADVAIDQLQLLPLLLLISLQFDKLKTFTAN